MHQTLYLTRSQRKHNNVSSLNNYACKDVLRFLERMNLLKN